MSLTFILQIFLLFDVFFMGMLATVTLQHARAHFKAKLAMNAQAPDANSANHDNISPMVRDHLLQESEAKFQDVLNNSAAQLEASLGSTASQLDGLLKQLGTEIVGNELERYRTELQQLRTQAQADMGTIKTAIESRRTELEEQLQQELAVEKQRLIAQIDTKLADAVSSFLVETLQHNIDLGAQEPYLRSMLEAHKQEFMQEVVDEPDASK